MKLLARTEAKGEPRLLHGYLQDYLHGSKPWSVTHGYLHGKMEILQINIYSK